MFQVESENIDGNAILVIQEKIPKRRQEGHAPVLMSSNPEVRWMQNM